MANVGPLVLYDQPGRLAQHHLGRVSARVCQGALVSFSKGPAYHARHQQCALFWGSSGVRPALEAFSFLCWKAIELICGSQQS